MRSDLLELESSESDRLLSNDELDLQDESSATQPVVEHEGLLSRMRAFPRVVYFIFCTEFCERFEYYGMRAVLLLYLVSIGYPTAQATALYHGFIVMCYFSPLLGAVLSDGFLGKYRQVAELRVIVYLSILYAIGSLALAISSCRPHVNNTWTDVVGLTVIAIGTGGIKPCVGAFGADQFTQAQHSSIDLFFSFFYACINMGSLLSMIVTPLLRTTRCFGEDTCYPLSFGIPAILMMVAVVVFVCGDCIGYRKVIPRTNTIARVIQTCTRGIVNRYRAEDKRRDHWLEYSLDTHKCSERTGCSPEHCAQVHFVADVRAMFSVFVVYLPLPFFWALYDQQGSRWLIQSSEMNYTIAGWAFPPAILQALNALLILLFIPLFEKYIYPLLRRCGIEPTPLRRMVCGCFLTALSFVVAALVQFPINATLPRLPAAGTSHLAVINTLPCSLQLASADYTDGHSFTATATGGASSEQCGTNYLCDLPAGGNYSWRVHSSSPVCAATAPSSLVTPLPQRGQFYYTVIADGLPNYVHLGTQLKDEQALGLFKMNINDYRPSKSGAHRLLLCRDTPCDLQSRHRHYVLQLANRSSAFVAIEPVRWHVFDDGPNVTDIHITVEVLRQGGIFTFTLFDDATTTSQQGEVSGLLYRIAGDNTVNILWQVPQFAIITAAEILVSITGLQFSYSQASPELKSVLVAAFYLTSAFGNLIIIAVADTEIFSNMAYELLFFAGLMAVISVVFMLIAMFCYEYRYYTETSSPHRDSKSK